MADAEPDTDTGPETDTAPETTTEPEPAGPGRLARFGDRLRRALLPRLTRLVVSVLAGALMCVSFPPWGWWYCAFPALAALGWVLTRTQTTRAGGFGYGLVFGLAFYVPLLPWIGSLVGTLPWLALALLQALFPALFGLLAVLVRGLPGWPVWFAAEWAVGEWLKSVVPFGGFPWGVVGFSQAGGPLLPLAQIGGAPLVSVAVALVGFSLTAIGLEIVLWWRHGHPDHAAATTDAARPEVVLPGLCICVVLLGTALVWPAVRQAGAGAGAQPSITVAAVQGNVPRLGLDFNAQRRAVLDNHVAETLRLAADVQAGRAPQPMVVIWPENSSDIDPLINADAGAEIAQAARAVHAPILVGTVLRAPGYTPENPAATNTVMVWDDVTGPGQRHDKKIVQPFGEYLPWRSFFRHISSYADRAGFFVPGTGDGVVQAAGVPIGVTTCWEVIFDRAAREAVLNGAQLLTVPTNNATFDEAMSAQQLAFARLRAVEHDRYVVVAGTTGISAVIAPDGRELARTKFFEPAYLDASVRLKSGLTVATVWGPAIQIGLIVIGVAAVIAAMLHNGGFFVRRHEGSFVRRRRTAASAGLDLQPDAGRAGQPDAGSAEEPDAGSAKEPDSGSEDKGST
ncbi:apolipoprotein N-acyltransferase [Mycolicibacterium cosmeticum]|uniref:apolipoprotein N-acyltransferase n=1 Tax=Mycolicibacterium cosmeticum TaxID=258533 RepID=UPI003204C81A